MLFFKDVAETFLKIESKSGRLEMTDILAQLFKKTDVKEIDKLIYLVQGILAPPYDGIELGLGEQFAIRAIASAAGYDRSKVESNYKKSGDLGLTIEELFAKKKQQSLSSSDMDVLYIYDSFVKMAKTSGQGSQELKIKYLTELLNNSSPTEARFIIRFVTGRLRLGVGDPTILDALSFSRTGDKSLREELERAYNVCSDLGYVAKTFFESPEKIVEFKVQPFKPLQPALAERLSTPKEIIEKLGSCSIEFKFDGFRLQCHKKGNEVELYSRKLEKMTHMFPDVVDAIKKLKVKEIIFEGEALAFNEPQKRYFSFQQTMHRRRKHGIDAASKELPLNIFVFDILYLNGKDLTAQPYSSRRKTLESIFPEEILKLSEKIDVKNEKEIEKLFKQSISEGLEGIMAKDLASPYTAGKRKFAWIKLKKSYGKAVDTIDGVIVGYYLGKGARVEFEFGGLLLAVYNEDNARLETVARIGSGYTEEEMKELQEMLEEIKTTAPPDKLDYKVEPDFWVQPKYVVEVAFDDITLSPMHTCGVKDDRGYALRFPRMQKMRGDKSISEITTTREVVDLYEKQMK
ncbi:MAG: ATP-dependent DNA ligase [Candidatus Micrarchaeota archaeon]|nr:ATP-dependent DNA ligase [Candidatus Micrarchaeota archaeon]